MKRRWGLPLVIIGGTALGLLMVLGVWLGIQRTHAAVLAPPGPGWTASSPTAPWSATEIPTPPTEVPVRVAGAEWVSGTLTVTVQAGPLPGDLLFAAPALNVDGQEREPRPASVAAARHALFQAGGGDAKFELVFPGVAAAAGEAQLTFNPASEAGDAARPHAVLTVTWP